MMTREKQNQVTVPRQHRRLHRQPYPVPPRPHNHRKQKQTQPKELHASLQRPYPLPPMMNPTTNPITKRLLVTMLLHPSLKSRPIHHLRVLQLREATASCRLSRVLRPLHGHSRRYLMARRCCNSFRTSGRTSSGKNTPCIPFLLRRRMNASTT